MPTPARRSRTRPNVPTAEPIAEGPKYYPSYNVRISRPTESPPISTTSITLGPGSMNNTSGPGIMETGNSNCNLHPLLFFPILVLLALSTLLLIAIFSFKILRRSKTLKVTCVINFFIHLGSILFLTFNTNPDLLIFYVLFCACLISFIFTFSSVFMRSFRKFQEFLEKNTRENDDDDPDSLTPLPLKEKVQENASAPGTSVEIEL